MKDGVLDVVIIGGGQSALACAFYLRRLDLKYLIVEMQKSGGGSWQHAWDSLTLFSPSEYSSLPGWQLPKSENKFPTKDEVIAYLKDYAEKYKFPIQYETEVSTVKKDKNLFQIQTNKGLLRARAVISATGTWQRPIIPTVEGRELFAHEQIHSAFYKNADSFTGKKVLIVGEGNSGAQILAEVSKTTVAKWATNKKPAFLPDDVDGYTLFSHESEKYKAIKAGIALNDNNSPLGNVVMVPALVEARERGVLESSGSILQITEHGVIWSDGRSEKFDVIIWCTGFGYATKYLSKLIMFDGKGKSETNESRSLDVSGLWFVGYGSWTGFASATLIGVGRTAKQTALEIDLFLKQI